MKNDFFSFDSFNLITSLKQVNLILLTVKRFHKLIEFSSFIFWDMVAMKIILSTSVDDDDDGNQQSVVIIVWSTFISCICRTEE